MPRSKAELSQLASCCSSRELYCPKQNADGLSRVDQTPHSYHRTPALAQRHDVDDPTTRGIIRPVQGCIRVIHRQHPTHVQLGELIAESISQGS
jgi:hypothetical protein